MLAVATTLLLGTFASSSAVGGLNCSLLSATDCTGGDIEHADVLCDLQC
jgi:hypothetical protein